MKSKTKYNDNFLHIECTTYFKLRKTLKALYRIGCIFESGRICWPLNLWLFWGVNGIQVDLRTMKLMFHGSYNGESSLDKINPENIVGLNEFLNIIHGN